MNITSAKKAEEFVYVAKRDNNQKNKSSTCSRSQRENVSSAH
jgi:hypothetical protein